MNYNEAMWKRCLSALKAFLNSSWMLPLGAAAVLLLGFLLNVGSSMLANYLGEAPGWLWGFAITGGLLFLLGVLSGLCVPLWLLIMTVWLLKQHLLKRVLFCWGSSALAAVVAFGVANGMILYMLSGGPDCYAAGLTVPEDKEFVLPRNMTFFCNMDIPPRVEALRSLRPELPEIPRVYELSAATAQEFAALNPQVLASASPEQLHEYMQRARQTESLAGAHEVVALNLQKLSAEAPELLQEYMLRALYAEASNLRFNSPVLAADSLIYPAHENDPQAHVLRAYLAECKIYSSEGERTYADYPTARWKYPLQNGWYVAHRVGFPFGNDNSVELPVVRAQLQRLDAALAPLAENPTREQLDALLPPTPEHPFLCIWEDGAGIYDMMIVIPADYEAGSFELRAHEYTTGKPILFRNRWRPEVKLGDVCRVISSDGSLMVSSGNWGEYYGSEWEIWFTPASGGEPRCVSRQPFLMMGWQH